METTRDDEKGSSESKFSVGVKVLDGMWSVTSSIPRHGTAYGALRVSQARMSKSPQSTPTAVYELCYTVSPLSDLWGALSRNMLFSSRFLVRNDSKALSFEVKQSGSDDKTALPLSPGEVLSFHWSSASLPELVSVRPLVTTEGLPMYQWSGGLDPLTIGSVPLRIRHFSDVLSPKTTYTENIVRSIQAETEVRPRTGGTGINISFREEESSGLGALFRIENHSLFPIWFSQDGMLANHSTIEAGIDESVCGDLVRPSEGLAFALDVPFRQGKYAGRRAATFTELLRLRLALFPLFSRAGIETSKVVSFTSAGERVHLNPSKLLFLDDQLRKSIRNVRVLGLVVNDGPTRVLRLWCVSVLTIFYFYVGTKLTDFPFSLMKKSDPDNIFGKPFEDERSASINDHRGLQCHVVKFSQEISDAAQEASNLFLDRRLPSEDEAVERAIFDVSRSYAVETKELSPQPDNLQLSQSDTVVSFRAAFQGFVVSLIDTSPSEICVISLRNLNALGNWNTQRTTGSTFYLTVTGLQGKDESFPVPVKKDKNSF